MNYTKPSVTGVDIHIQKMQTVLYNQLKTKWSLTDTSFNMFGRAYRNQVQKGYQPEVYVGNSEYSDAYFDDTISASAFWGVEEKSKVVHSDATANIYVVFMVNLDKVKPGTTRNDEEVRIDVEQIALNGYFGFFLTGITTGIEQVFKEYNIGTIKYRDTQPWHCFRLGFSLTYNVFDCN